MNLIKRFLSWIVLGLFLYLMLQSETKNKPLPSPAPVKSEAVKETTPAAPAETEPAKETEFSKAMDAERWKRALNPDYAAKFQCSLDAKPGEKPQLIWKVMEEKPGKGSPARCSETIAVKLTVWNTHGESAYSDTIQLQLGTRQIAAGLDAALVGIRPGGTRIVILSPTALTRAGDAKPPKALAAALSKNMVVVTAERVE